MFPETFAWLYQSTSELEPLTVEKNERSVATSKHYDQLLVKSIAMRHLGLLCPHLGHLSKIFSTSTAEKRQRMEDEKVAKAAKNRN